MQNDYSTILRDIEVLRRVDPHKYVLNPPLPDSGVLLFEAEHGILLPTEYREFLFSVGNGGAGPGYGVEMLGCAYGVDWSETPGLIGDLAISFPHTDRWNADAIDGSLPVDEQFRQQNEYWDSSW